DRESEQRREQQRQPDILCLSPVDPAADGMAGEERVCKTYSKNRSDERMRTGGRKTIEPCAEIPEDGGDQQSQHRGKSSSLGNQYVNRKEMNDSQRDSYPSQKYSQEIANPRPDDRCNGAK